jgi:DNA mismatch endonuclease (patch repair protein)
MVDVLTKQQRSMVMSRVRRKDTKPEFILRTALHQLGFRYRLDNGKLPGRPDITLPRYKTAIFVHGCFWHRHTCAKASTPDTNILVWAKKFEDNVARDQKNYGLLKDMGYRVIVVWECELYSETIVTVGRVVKELVGDGSVPGINSLDRKLLLAVAAKRYAAAIRVKRNEQSKQ